MTTRILDISLSSFCFDDHPSLKRDRLEPANERSPNYDGDYDFATFFYDAWFDETNDEARLLCPSLMNFAEIAAETRFSIDGRESRIIGIDQLPRSDVIRLEARSGGSLTFSHPLFSGEVALGRTDVGIFAGLDVGMASARNHDVDWVADWARWHAKAQAMTGAVIFDCGPHDPSLAAALEDIPGLQAVAIIRAPFPFGPSGDENVNSDSRFLPLSLAELTRRRLVRKARAVLSAEIDECVWSSSDRTIFDAAAEHPDGFVRINGKWVYGPANRPARRHYEHRLARLDGVPKVNRKWCVAPNGPAKDEPWRTHRVSSKKDTVTDEFGFWRFRDVASDGMLDRGAWDDDQMVEDRRLVAAMSDAFGAPPTPHVAGRTGREEKLVITSMKNEGPYILEWIAHHRVIGFNRFLVFTNDCDDGTVEILQRLQDLGVVVHQHNTILRRGPQKSALKYAKTHPLAIDADWVLVSDIDEFLNIKIGEGHVDDLIDAVPGADVIPVTWRLFSHNDVVAFEDELVMEAFTDAEAPLKNGGAPNRFVKSLYPNSPAIQRYGTHGPIFAEGVKDNFTWIQPDGRRLNGANNLTRPESAFAYEIAQFNHYAVRSVDSYLVKRDRGRVNHYKQTMGLDYWTRMCRGGEKDLSIHRYLGPVKEEMERLKSDQALKTLHDASVRWHGNRIEELKRVPEFAEMRAAIMERHGLLDAHMMAAELDKAANALRRLARTHPEDQRRREAMAKIAEIEKLLST